VKIISPDSDAELRAGETFDVVAEVDDDSGATTLALDWTLDPEPETPGNPFYSDGEATLYLDKGLPEGDCTITLTATDNAGVSESDSIHLEIGDNKRPRVVIRQPQEGERYDDADLLIVEVEVDPRDDVMSSIELLWDGVAKDAPDAPSFPPDDGLVIFTIENLDTGSSELTVTARDQAGEDDTDTVEFSVR
jgi:hypothetical protein